MLITPAERGDLLRITEAVRRALGEKDFAAEFDRGAKLSLEEAFALLP
jgi:hypothetical protein